MDNKGNGVGFAKLGSYGTRIISCILLIGLAMLIMAYSHTKIPADGDVNAGVGTSSESENGETVQNKADNQRLLSDMKNMAIANPWGETQSLSVAEDSSEVLFNPPTEDSLPGGTEPVALQTYRYMDGTIEALYGNGKDELCIRKSYELEGQSLSGDYNEYSNEWEATLDGIVVHCLGDGEKANSVFFDDDGHFSILYNPGIEGQGLDSDELEAIIMGLKG